MTNKDKEKMISKHKGTLVFRSVFVLLWFLPLIPMFAAKYYDMPYLAMPSLVLYSLMILSGIASYSDLMFRKVLERGNYEKNALDFSWNIYMRVIYTLIIAYAFVYLGYDIYGYLFLLSSGGEAHLHNKIVKELKNRKK